MIGGDDIRLPSMAGDSSIVVAVRAVRQAWRQAVFENALTGARYNDFSQIPFGEIDEIFVYRDSAVADEWDASGAVPELYNTMIHILADEGFITVVVDERNATMERIIEAIKSGLGNDIFCTPAGVAA